MSSTARTSAGRSAAALGLTLLVVATCAAADPAPRAGAALEPPAVCAAAQVAASVSPGGAPLRRAARRFDGDAFVRTELFFGSERPDAPPVSAEEFAQFVDVVVTPCFPDGLTVLTGTGQFREADGRIVREASFVLLLLYPLEARADGHAKIEAIRALYQAHFDQQSVLRVDDPRAVRVGF